jgi:hypothetical protein
MARTTPRPTPTTTQTLLPMVRHCPCCGNPMWAAYHNYRTLTTLEAVLRLTLQMRRCLNANCPQFRKPYRPETEGLSFPIIRIHSNSNFRDQLVSNRDSSSRPRIMKSIKWSQWSKTI